MSQASRHLASLISACAGLYLLTCLPAVSTVPGAAVSGATGPAEGDGAPSGQRAASSALPAASSSGPPTLATGATPCTGSARPVAGAPPLGGSHRYAVVAESPSAAQAASEVLERGGSAADAAVVGLLVAGVSQPVSSGIGGGGFALYWEAATGRVSVLDFREVAPAALRAEDYVDRPPAAPRRGVMVGVPGEVAGLSELHRRWGKLAFADLARQAVKAARDGFPVSYHQARALRWNEAWALKTAPVAAVFAPLGRLLAAGETARNPALGDTLERIAAEGQAAVYEGAIARDIVDTARAAGSRMTLDDLRGYRVAERRPLHTRWHDHDVYTMPPPSAGGLMVLETLNMHSRDELRQLGHGSGAYQHLLAETFRGAVADRIRAVGDPAFVDMDIDGLAAPARMKARRARMAPDRTNEAPAFPLREAGTSHFAATDQDGNVVAITSTVNNMFGAKLFARGGFPLNDELDDFTELRIEQRFGVTGGPNAPRAGARPVSSMTPTIVLRDGRPVLAIGGSGGTRIATGVAQVLLAKLAFDRTTEQAVADPRIHTPPGGSLLTEPDGAADVVADLQARGEVVTPRPNYSAVGLLSLDYGECARRLEAHGDPRKGGVGIAK